MTSNAVQYWRNVETKRNNIANLAEMTRHNLETERLTGQANENTKFSNVENQRHNLATERFAQSQLSANIGETRRHNIAQERETTRHNILSESNDSVKALASMRSADAANVSAQSNRINAATNRMNYAVNLQNAASNQKNATSNLMNAYSNQTATQIKQQTANEQARHNLVSELSNAVQMGLNLLTTFKKGR